MGKKIIFFSFRFLLVAGVGIFGLWTVIYAWQEPGGGPPSANVPAPLNVGSANQYTDGALGVGGVFRAYNKAVFESSVTINNAVFESSVTINKDNAGIIYLDNTGFSAVNSDASNNVWVQANPASKYIAFKANGWYFQNAARNVVSIANSGTIIIDGADTDIATGPNQDLVIMPNGSGKVGIGDTTPASLLTVGSGDLFQVNSSGNLVKINNVTYSWPASQGLASTYLKNDGSGNLSWGAVSGGLSSVFANIANSAGTVQFSAAGADTLRFADDSNNGLSVSFDSNSKKVNYAIDTSKLQKRVTGSCSAGSSIRSIASDGQVACETDDSGITAEADPKVGTLASGKWCTTDGSKVNCSSDAPTTIEADTLQSVTDRGFLTTQNVGVKSLTVGIGQSSGILEMADGASEEGDITRLNKITGYNDIIIYGNSAKTAPIYLEGSNVIINNDAGTGNVGIGDTSPVSLLTVGSGDLFQVNSSGNLVRINNVPYSWPASQGSASTYLKNDGSGSLSWAAVSGGLSSVFANIANSAGTVQFSAAGADTLRFADDSNNGLSVSFDSNSKKVNYAIDTSKLQKRVTGFCSANSSIRSIASDGQVACETDDSGITAEADPKVGTLASGKWCTTDGSKVNCSSDAPSGGVGGSGADNYLPRWSGTGALESSGIYQKDTGEVGIGTTIPGAKLAVGGAGSAGDAIAAYANSANSALYAEQANAAGYAGYFTGKAYVSANLTVGGLANCPNLKTNSVGLLLCDSTSYLTSEADPQVGTITASGKWCTTDGSKINCASDAPAAGSFVQKTGDTMTGLLAISQAGDDMLAFTHSGIQPSRRYTFSVLGSLGGTFAIKNNEGSVKLKIDNAGNVSIPEGDLSVAADKKINIGQGQIYWDSANNRLVIKVQ